MIGSRYSCICSFFKFDVWFELPPHPPRQAAEQRSMKQIVALRNRLSTLLVAKGMALQDTFRAFDRDGDGRLDEGELVAS